VSKNKQIVLGITIIISLFLTYFLGYIGASISTLPIGEGRNLYNYITKELENNYLYQIEDYEKTDAFVSMLEGIINSYRESNGDPYTRLQVVDLSTSPFLDGEFIGIGAQIFIERDYLRIGKIYNNSAAYGKLYPDELITSVIKDNVVIDFVNKTKLEIETLLKGKVGDEFTFRVIKLDQSVEFVTLIYKAFSKSTVYLEESTNKDIPIIKITKFEDNGDLTSTHVLFYELLKKVELDYSLTEGKTLVIDLRENPGGSLNCLYNKQGVMGIVQQLIIKDTNSPLFSLTNNENKQTPYYGGLRTAKPYDIVCLVNNMSASASEILAASLYSAGYNVYGNETYGKDVYQTTVRLVDIGYTRYELTYTAGTWMYGDNLFVSTNPIPIKTYIGQTGLYSAKNVKFNNNIYFDSVDTTNLVLVQEYLKTFYKTECRTDGYFDEQTRQLLLRFQKDTSLNEDGIYNYETFKKMHDFYVFYLSDSTYDAQLNKLLEIIG
jgi:carboxyl-terminal processing protease